MACRSFYFDFAGQFAVDDAPLVVIDDPIIVPCTAVLPQLASTLIEPPSPVGEKKWRNATQKAPTTATTPAPNQPNIARLSGSRMSHHLLMATSSRITQLEKTAP
jgi:hypothetical protein